MRILLSFLLIFFFASQVYAQKSYEKDLEVADAFLEIEEFENAHYYYQRAYTKHKTTEIYRKIAWCTLLKRDYENAVRHYEELTTREDKLPVDLLHYARVLQYMGQYQSAVQWLKEYQSQYPGDSILARQRIASCDSSFKWSKEYNNTEVNNLEKINSEFSDIAPAFYKEGILFCSSREVTIIKKKEGSSGLPFYDFYFSRKDNWNLWTSPSVFSTELNTKDHEGPATFSHDFTDIYFTRCEDRQRTSASTSVNHLKLYKSTKRTLGWSAPESFMFNDSSNSFAHPSISKNGKIFFFASDRPGGYGGSDLYVSFRLDSALWSIPVNLGPAVNTPGNELYPFFLEEEGVLYFSSDGHPGMGGFDIYYAELDGKEWINITNVKPPINSSFDDFSFIIDEQKTKAYFSSNRPEGKGKEDIYSVIFR